MALAHLGHLPVDKQGQGHWHQWGGGEGVPRPPLLSGLRNSRIGKVPHLPQVSLISLCLLGTDWLQLVLPLSCLSLCPHLEECVSRSVPTATSTRLMSLCLSVRLDVSPHFPEVPAGQGNLVCPRSADCSRSRAEAGALLLLSAGLPWLSQAGMSLNGLPARGGGQGSRDGGTKASRPTLGPEAKLPLMGASSLLGSGQHCWQAWSLGLFGRGP